MGVSPFGSYFQNHSESVSPSGGSLSVSATDLLLPGRDGFDLVIKRMYDSTAAEQEKIIGSNTKTPIDTFSNGWSLNIPWIEYNDKGHFLRLPEGQTIKIEWKNNKFEYHEGSHFLLQRSVDNNYFLGILWSSATQGYILTLKDGTRFEFDKSGKPKRMISPGGKNEIKYEYDGRKIKRIIDSIGNEVTFTYITVGNEDLIAGIRVNDRIVRYEYDSLGQLTKAYDPMNRMTVYEYYRTELLNSGNVTFESMAAGKGEIMVSTNAAFYNLGLLTGVTYPTGEKSTYEYLIRNQYDEYQSGNHKVTYKGHKIVVKKHKVAGKEVNYEFRMNENPRGSLSGGNYIPKYSLVYSSTVTEGEKSIIERYKQVIKDNGYSLRDNPETMSNFKGNIVVERIIKDNGADYEKVVFGYSERNLALRVTGNEDHLRGGEIVYSVENDYDSWGNLTYRFDSSRRLEEHWSYHEHPAIKNLVDTYIKKNLNPVTGNYILTTTKYEYNEALGKPSKMTVTSGNETHTTSYLYYDNGNLWKKTEPNGLVTEVKYDAEKSAFPEEKIAHGVLDADGNAVGDIITKYKYDPHTGLKIWEEDPLGNRTTYEYDKLNRVTKVILPDDNDRYDNKATANNPSRIYNFNDTANTCEFINEKGQRTLFIFDGLGRLTEVRKYTNLYPENKVSTLYHYDALGRIDQVTDPLGRVTRYEYDGLNRVTKVIFPVEDGEAAQYVTLDYNDPTNTVTITDEEGGEVREKSDWANRLVEARQLCAFNGTTEVYTWNFIYDSLGNRVRQQDPLTNQSDYYFDGFGRLTRKELPGARLVRPGTSEPVELRPTIKYEYDPMGNKTAETDANGNRTQYQYDLLGRLVKVTTKSQDHLTGGWVTAVTRHYYDAGGNKTKTIDPNGQEWTYTYSARGYLLTETDPEGNTIRYQYDKMGNKTAVTDPRGNGEDGRFTTWYLYDDLNRLYRTVLPDETPPSLTDLAAGNYDNPYMEIKL